MLIIPLKTGPVLVLEGTCGLWLVPAELLVGQDQSLQSDGEADVAAGHHVLDLEVQEAGREAKLLHHSSVFPSCELRLFLTGQL